MRKGTGVRHFLMQRRVPLFLAAIFVFHMINNYFILVRERFSDFPVAILESRSYEMSMKYFHLIKKYFGSGIISDFRSWFQTVTDGPLYFITAQPFYFLFGTSKSSAIFSNSLYFLILLVSVYALGKKMMSQGAGVLAALLVSFIPAIFGYSQVFHTPFALTALTAMGMAALYYSDGFSDRRQSIFFGLSAGLLGITKFIGAIYLLGPFLYFFVLACIDGYSKKQLTGRLVNMLFSFAACLVTILAWYHSRESWTWTSYRQSYHMVNAFNFKINADFRYVELLFKGQLFLLYSTLFILCLPVFLFMRVKNKTALLLWMIVPLVFFTLYWSCKESYFTIPCLPAVAVVISLVITQLAKNVKLKAVLIATLSISLLAQYYLLPYQDIDDYFLARQRRDYRLRDSYSLITAKVLKALDLPRYPRASLLFLTVSREGSAVESLLVEETSRKDLKVAIFNPLDCIYSASFKFSEMGIGDHFFEDKDFVITTSVNSNIDEDLKKRPSSHIRDAKRLLVLFDENKDTFTLAATIPGPRSEDLRVYVKNAGKL